MSAVTTGIDVTDLIERGMIGQSGPMLALKAQIRRLAEVDVTTLIQGPSGTGKELAARLIHQLSIRQKRPWVAINCAAIPDDLFESELFGHVEGAFTGAQGLKKGLITTANKGTLFLDEVGELGGRMQAKLLRVLQEGLIRPIGSALEHPVDIRVIAASHQPLPKLVDAGTFRLDLFHRLHVACIELPSLQAMRSDIPLLSSHLLAKAAARYALPEKPLDQEAQNALFELELPGNVRELDHLLTSGLIWSTGSRITKKDLGINSQKEASIADRVENRSAGLDLVGALEQTERRMIQKALCEQSHNKKAAAFQLGISERALRYRLQKFPQLRPKGGPVIS